MIFEIGGLYLNRLNTIIIQKDMIEGKSKKSILPNINIETEKLYNYLYQIPPKKGRYIALSIEIKIFDNKNRLFQLGLYEIKDGIDSGVFFATCVSPKPITDKKFVPIEPIEPSDYMDWKQNLLIALEFIGNSLIFVHNAPQDIIKLNNELDFWGLPKIPLKMFRISKFIFLEIIQKDNPLYDKKIHRLRIVMNILILILKKSFITIKLCRMLLW